MVLDGAIDLEPCLGVTQEIDEQSAAFDGDLEAALHACVASSSCAWKPVGDPVAAFERLLAQVRAHPLPVRGSSRTVGPSELLYGTALTLYSTSYWSDLYTSLAQAETGDGADMLDLFDQYVGRNQNGSYSNEFEANAAVNCLDAPAPPIPTIEAGAAAEEQAAPVFGVAGTCTARSSAPFRRCRRPGAGWPPSTPRVSPPIVVVGTTGDPATPYAQAQALAGQLDHGVLLTRVGEGHTAYDFSSCIRNYVDDYLTNLTVPPAGTAAPATDDRRVVDV